MNLHNLPPKQAMTGITLSFTATHGLTNGEKIAAQMQLNKFAAAIHDFQKEHFPMLKHTVISRQEYEP